MDFWGNPQFAYPVSFSSLYSNNTYTSPYENLTYFGLNAGNRPWYAFEVNQTCSSARLERGLLNAQLCAPLKNLPPYICIREVRDPILEIVSNAWAQTSLVIGGYFALCAMWIKYKLKKSEEAAETAAVKQGGSDERHELADYEAGPRKIETYV